MSQEDFESGWIVGWYRAYFEPHMRFQRMSSWIRIEAEADQNDALAFFFGVRYRSILWAFFVQLCSERPDSFASVSNAKLIGSNVDSFPSSGVFDAILLHFVCSSCSSYAISESWR